MATKYIKVLNIRKFAHERGRKVSKEFIQTLDRLIADKIADTCKIHNGGRKTLKGYLLPSSSQSLHK